MQRRLYIDEAHTTLDIPLKISRFHSAIYRRCGHFFLTCSYLGQLKDLFWISLDSEFMLEPSVASFLFVYHQYPTPPSPCDLNGIEQNLFPVLYPPKILATASDVSGSVMSNSLEFSDDAGNILASYEKKTTCGASIAVVSFDTVLYLIGCIHCSKETLLHGPWKHCSKEVTGLRRQYTMDDIFPRRCPRRTLFQ